VTIASDVVRTRQYAVAALAPRHRVMSIKAAEVLVVATPTYKGSCTGVLKVLLDHLPAQALAGKRPVPVVTAGAAPQAAAAEALLRQLLTEASCSPSSARTCQRASTSWSP
jgi:NAD(P)H-dependent FMN reductase